MSQNFGQRMQHIDKASKLSIVRQCELLGINRSGLYYQPAGETPLNLELMQIIDEKHMLHPWLGVPRMTQWLCKDKGYVVYHKRIERLFDMLGIQALGPKPNTSKPAKGHKVYPYLLGGLEINRANHVWAMDGYSGLN